MLRGPSSGDAGAGVNAFAGERGLAEGLGFSRPTLSRGNSERAPGDPPPSRHLSLFVGLREIHYSEVCAPIRYSVTSTWCDNILVEEVIGRC